MFRKLLDQGQAGDNVGILLRGTKRDDVERGQVLCKPGSITPHTKFKGEVYILTKEEGGRHTPFFSNYRPQFYFRTTDVTGSIKLPEGTEMVMPGDNVAMEVDLIAPIAMEKGLRFAIREGGRTVGAGVVADIIASRERGADRAVDSTARWWPLERRTDPFWRRGCGGLRISVWVGDFGAGQALSDDQYRLIERMIRGQAWGRPRTTDIHGFSTGCSTSYGPAASGAICTTTGVSAWPRSRLFRTFLVAGTWESMRIIWS